MFFTHIFVAVSLLSLLSLPVSDLFVLVVGLNLLLLLPFRRSFFFVRHCAHSRAIAMTVSWASPRGTTFTSFKHWRARRR